MPNAFLSASVICAVSLLQTSSPQALPAIFGQAGTASPVPSNVARYILDLEEQGIYLHYFGDGQIFSWVLSPALRDHLQHVANTSDAAGMPIVYGVDHLTDSQCDWNKVAGWTSLTKGADAKAVFYGREIRSAPQTVYGNAIHLSLGPDDDPEGWTSDEMTENLHFWHAIHKEGKGVYEADGVRQFRNNVASQLGGSFLARWGDKVTTKAHRFALQMYTAESQDSARNSGALFFEMFPTGMPPTQEVVFFEAEDGCKGTPTPSRKLNTLQKTNVDST